MLEHSFTGPQFTVGVEEELMLVDAKSLDLAHGIETILAEVPGELEGQVKPELLQSVLEVATTPCEDVAQAHRELTALRQTVIEIGEANGMRVGAAGTHPFADWHDQRVVDRPRYKELAEELGYIARRELIFGTHVHVGIEGADKAIYVADGIRHYLPLLLAISSNSPYWNGDDTGLMSARTPVFRAFPRVGIPPHYGNWEIYSRRVELLMKAGVIEDYTFMWFDVRPHPRLGTVETRVFDQQTRLDHTVALCALTVSLARRFARLFRDGAPLVEAPTELVDDNKVRAALNGLEGPLVDWERGEQLRATEMASTLLEELREDAAELGCDAELKGIGDLCAKGTGARRQLDVVAAGADLPALVDEIIEKTRP